MPSGRLEGPQLIAGAQDSYTGAQLARGARGAKLSFHYHNWDMRLDASHLNLEHGSFRNPLAEARLGPRVSDAAKSACGAQGLQLRGEDRELR